MLDEKERREIVIVDDEPGIAELLKEVLFDEGFHPIVFTRAAPALAHIHLYPPALVITDLLLPGIRGEQLVASVRSRFGADMPIVAMSASLSTQVLAALPVDAVLTKPFDLDELVAIAHDLTSRSGRINSTATPRRRLRMTVRR